MVLLSIAVAEEAKGTGVAVALIDGFEKELRRAHVTSYSLSVVKSNARAIGFYKKMGFKPIQPSDCCMWQLQKSMASNQDFQAVVQSQEGELDCGT
jgi:N-acetylglutamate synthase-like GNAT family acetyltransferase